VKIDRCSNIERFPPCVLSHNNVLSLDRIWAEQDPAHFVKATLYPEQDRGSVSVRESEPRVDGDLAIIRFATAGLVLQSDHFFDEMGGLPAGIFRVVDGYFRRLISTFSDVFPCIFRGIFS